MTRWRVTFIDAVTAKRIEIDVDARDAEAARALGWEALRRAAPTSLVVVDLVDIRRADVARGPVGPEGGRS